MQKDNNDDEKWKLAQPMMNYTHSESIHKINYAVCVSARAHTRAAIVVRVLCIKPKSCLIVEFYLAL